MPKLIEPHGGSGLICARICEDARDAALRRAKGLRHIEISSRARGDLLMLGNGAFSPLTGFMDRENWKSVCESMLLSSGVFWPMPVTLDISAEDAAAIRPGEEVALVFEGEIYATMTAEEIYPMTEDDLRFECELVYKGQGPDSEDFWANAPARHPGVQKVLAQKPFNLAGRVCVLSDGPYAEAYPSLYLTPDQLRTEMEDRGWGKVAALHLRTPMHRAHEYLAKMALEVCDGLVLHSKLADQDTDALPANVCVATVEAVRESYFPEGNTLHAGSPLEMRFAGPREALLHAVVRQNYGISHQIFGPDHASVAEFYCPYESQEIFCKLPQFNRSGSGLLCKPLNVGMIFYCSKCDGMATEKTCPHGKLDRTTISATKLHRYLSQGKTLPAHFARSAVIDILRDYFDGKGVGQN